MNKLRTIKTFVNHNTINESRYIRENHRYKPLLYCYGIEKIIVTEYNGMFNILIRPHNVSISRKITQKDLDISDEFSNIGNCHISHWDGRTGAKLAKLFLELDGDVKPIIKKRYDIVLSAETTVIDMLINKLRNLIKFKG